MSETAIADHGLVGSASTSTPPLIAGWVADGYRAGVGRRVDRGRDVTSNAWR
jgi:hypothetical protein